jgi:hypothetical protein
VPNPSVDSPALQDRDAFDDLVRQALLELGGSGERAAIVRRAVSLFRFTTAQLAVPAPPSKVRQYPNRIEYELSWALSRLHRDGVITSPRRAFWTLSDHCGSDGLREASGDASHPRELPDFRAAREWFRLVRQRDSEVQWGGVLNHVLAMDLRNGAAFARAILESVDGSDGVGKGRRGLASVPDWLRVSDEVGLAGMGRGRSQRLGRVDLVLGSTDYTWQLNVELKLEAKYGKGQLENYLQHGAPAVAVVRRRSDCLPPAVTDHDSWVGEATWHDVMPTLEDLHISNPETKKLWSARLEVMRDETEWDDSELIEHEGFLARELAAPIHHLVRGAVEATVGTARGSAVEVSIQEARDRWVVLVSDGPAEVAAQGFAFTPYVDGPQLAAIGLTWLDLRGVTRGRRLSAGALAGNLRASNDIAETLVRLDGTEREAPIAETVLEIVEPFVERWVAHGWRARQHRFGVKRSK